MNLTQLEDILSSHASLSFEVDQVENAPVMYRLFNIRAGKAPQMLFSTDRHQRAEQLINQLAQVNGYSYLLAQFNTALSHIKPTITVRGKF